MLDAKDMVAGIQRLVIDTINAGSPSNFVFGTVISEQPLRIQIEQKIILAPEQLVLCRDVTEYETKVTIGVSAVGDSTLIGETLDATWTGGGATIGCAHTPSPVLPHHHELKFSKHIKTKIIVHNALKTGEKVALIREQGGQRYLVVDRVVGS